MTNKTKVIVGLIAAVGLLVLGVTLARTVNLGAASVNAYQAGVWWFGNGFYAGTSQQFGVDGNGYVDTSGQFRSTATSTTVNGVSQYHLHMALTSATTTPCDLTTPPATTTLRTFSVGASVGSTTAFIVPWLKPVFQMLRRPA